MKGRRGTGEGLAAPKAPPAYAQVHSPHQETLEELNLSLADHGEPLGRLPDLPAIARGKHIDMLIAPFVYYLRHTPPLTPSDEVAEALWFPLSPLVSGALRTIHPYDHMGQRLELPGHRLGERVVWGLTYQMLEALFERIAPT